MKRVAILGYGAIARMHAAQLREVPDVAIGAVFGPDPAKAMDFARSFGIPRSASELAQALKGMDAAIICSPSAHHFSQAQTAIERVPAVLVELPACGSIVEADALADAASRRGASLHCAHTSRYLRPYMEVGRRFREGELGAIMQVRYARVIPRRNKNWVDDALLHHAEHPLDLFLAWFGDVKARGCVTFPNDAPEEVAILAALANGAPVSASISYGSRIPSASMTVVGSKHTVETDGFRFLRSDRDDFNGEYDEQAEYEDAIGAQDRAFLTGEGVPWTEAIRLATLVIELRRLA